MKFRYLISALVLLISCSVFAQNRTVSGTVVDEQNLPLIGAAVLVENTPNGTVTDLDGNYSIDVARGQVLVFEYMGYTTSKVTVSDQKTLNVQLLPSSEMMEELVVVGYGVQKKVNVTGSVSTVKYDEMALSRPATNSEGLLKGASAGLYVYQNSGKPGGEGIDIKIRGIGTLNSSNPLVIVDGFESSMGNVDPADIESVSILKDAASCAIYGNRGANGVVLITTKSAGKDKFTIEYNGMVAMQEASNYVPLISNYADYMMIVNESAENVNTTPPFSQTMIDLWTEKSLDPYGIAESGYPNYVAYPNTDWMKEMYQTNVYQKHSIMANGSGKRTRYALSLAYMNNPGIVDNTGMEKFSMRVNVSSQVTDFLEIGARIFGYKTSREVCDFDASQQYMARAVPGIYPYYDGKYGWMENAEQDSMSRNNLYFLNRANGHDGTFYANATAFMNISLPFDIKWNTSFNYIYTNTYGYFVRGKGNAWSFSQGEIAYRYDTLSNFSRNDTYDEANRWTLQTNLSWNKSFGKHDVSAIVGFEAFEDTSHNLSASKSQFENDILQEMDNIIKPSSTKGGRTEYATASVFGRVTYAYDGKYLFEANLRYDGSSRFAARSRWGLFPSVSAGWRISEEDFMKDTGIDNLKLRLSWGQLGNNSVGNYAYQSLYGSGYKYSFGGTATSGLVSTLSNELLRWETTSTTDVGLEFAVLNNRLTLEADYYNKYTDGILHAMPIMGVVGSKTPPTQNLCAVTNNGVELTLSWKDGYGDFTYGVSGNFTRNWNVVSKYNGEFEAGWVTDADGIRTYQSNIGEVSKAVDGTRRILEGKIINEFQVLEVYNGTGNHFFKDGSVNPEGGPKDGMIRTEKDMEWLRAMVEAGNSFLPNREISKSGIWYGDYIYRDANGDGVYGDQNDYIFQNRSQTPKLFYGFTVNLGWKGIDFSAHFTGAAGGSMYWRESGFNAYAISPDSSIARDIAYDHYFYDPANPEDARTNLTSRNPRLTYNWGSEQNGAGVYSNLFLYKTDYFRLQNVTLGYTFPQKWMKKIKVQGLRVFFSGENLFTVTDYPGFDPASTSKIGSCLARYTSLRQYTFGLNLKF